MSNNELAFKGSREEFSVILSSLKTNRDTLNGSIKRLIEFGQETTYHKKELELTNKIIKEITKIMQ